MRAAIFVKGDDREREREGEKEKEREGGGRGWRDRVCVNLMFITLSIFRSYIKCIEGLSLHAAVFVKGDDRKRETEREKEGERRRERESMFMCI